MQKVAFCGAQDISRWPAAGRGDALLRSRDQSSNLKERLHQAFDRPISSSPHTLSLEDPPIDSTVHFEEVRLCPQRLGGVAKARLGEDFVGAEEDAKRIERKQRNGRRGGGESGEPVVAVEPVECLHAKR